MLIDIDAFKYSLQKEIKDDKYVRSSRVYSSLNDQLQHWNNERERYRALIDALKVKIFFVVLSSCVLCKLCADKL